MSNPSVRFVALSGIIGGKETEEIIEDILEQCSTDKDESAVKKDVNWYRSFAKKEGLVDEDGFATDTGEQWVENGGKKPVDPAVLAEREAKKKAAEEKKAAAKAEREAKAKAKAEEKAAAIAAKAEEKAKEAVKETSTIKKVVAKKAAAPKKPAAVAAAEAKAAQSNEA